MFWECHPKTTFGPYNFGMPRPTLILGSFVIAATGLLCLGGCEEEGASFGRLVKVWGRRGIAEGRLQKPRAVAIDGDDHLYIVDMTARIQVFDVDGTFLRGWQTPEHENGRPTGLSIDGDGNLLVADTHYYQVLVYSPAGKLLRSVGGTAGHGPGEFGLVTDAVVDRQGNMYVSEFGEYDRIQKFAPDGTFLLQWGGHGRELGQFVRPQNLAIDELDHIWVADACNHRIQIFDGQGKLLKHWGRHGSALGELSYPYDLVLARDGTVFVLEYGNHRVQRFTRDGQSLGIWGQHGREEGQTHNPWALVQDSQGRLLVLDTNNHRVQVVKVK